MNRNDDTKLWELLGKADSRPASSLFTQNVLNAIRDDAENEENPFTPAHAPATRSFFSLHRRALGLSAAAVLCVSLFLFQNERSPSSSGTEVVEMMPLTIKDISALEETASALEPSDTDTSLIEVASCYSDSLSEEELQYMLAYL